MCNSMCSKSLMRKSMLALREVTKTMSSRIIGKYSNSTAPVTSEEFYRRPLPRHCIAFSSTEGKVVFREALLAGHMEAYFGLAAQLCTQEEPAYCGLATLVMVLNAFEMDPGRVWKGPWRWYHETMLTCCVPPNVLTEGIVLDKFAEMARCNGLNVEMYRVYPNSKLSHFRELVYLMTSSDRNGFLVSCYDRRAIGQTGTGHFAAIGGYHPQRELVFLFDTARFKYPPHWVPLAKLWDGMGRVDPATQQPRGYLVITRATAVQKLPESRSDPGVLDTQGSWPFGDLNLSLFDISHSAWQAFMSPAALCDKASVGYRLRQVSDSWHKWLMDTPSPKHTEDKYSVVAEAAHFVLNACTRYSPSNFFFTIQPSVDASTSDVGANSMLNEHQLLRDLLSSPVGRTLARVVSEIPADRFLALTRETGTFHLTIGCGFGTGSQTPLSRAARCPFAELNDAGLRLTVLLTCFLLVSPACYPARPLRTRSTSPSTRQQMIIDLTNEIDLSDLARTEIGSLQTLYRHLLNSALSLDDKFVKSCGQRGKRFQNDA